MQPTQTTFKPFLGQSNRDYKYFKRLTQLNCFTSADNTKNYTKAYTEFEYPIQTLELLYSDISKIFNAFLRKHLIIFAAFNVNKQPTGCWLGQL